VLDLIDSQRVNAELNLKRERERERERQREERERLSPRFDNIKKERE
jgi:hypothetical protein